MTQTTDLADALLLRRIAGGDEEAFAEVYRQRQAAIYRFALHMTGNSALAEDVTQEVFMALIRDPKRFDPARGTGTGCVFNDYDAQAVRWALDTALDWFVDQKNWQRLMQNAMAQDFSWQRSVQRYIEVYERLLAQ